ncbi:MAG: UDP-N-acetylmuramoyl-tripeptide--D-alanyl-D-alanine ligase [Thermoanaerobacterales bacterium 50_218]|nr:MAG: UDP-N-acetylmuramoyl-tripeptide--D-alanyl-D-alanine ligase [Thermoanaerobacterales bacterium 50_218]HAA90418.1 UDP-N-acetylmuramoyl-tripeptide--D-alanyl-D-alanine ligase [Peptococcaceae bacterium]
MKPLPLIEVTKAVNGRLLSGTTESRVTGVSIDSRAIREGDLFFAFPGKRVDGHNFVEQALRKGAIGAVVSKRVPIKTEKPLILVEDTLKALQDLARYYRSILSVPVVAVTGSTGKTTTKDLIAAVLGVRYQVHKTEGNQNNEIGLPLTILRATNHHQLIVVELAMRARGEIAELAEISKPCVGVITNIGKTHLEKLGSQAEIAEAKGELLAFLPPDGCAVLNGEDPWQRFLANRVPGEVIFYGEDEEFPVRAQDVKLRGLEGIDFLLQTPAGKASCFLPLPGKHNLLNALAAASVGHWFGLAAEEIREGLVKARVTGMRLEVKKGIRGSRIIDDTYNASPDSVKAALQLLAAVGEKRRAIAVLGDMYELGPYEVPGHREVGETAASLHIDYLFTVGTLAEEIAQGARAKGMPSERIRSFADKQEVLAFLEGFLENGDLVLVKGSRALHMEEIVAGLCGQVINGG